MFPPKIYHEKKDWAFIILNFSPFLWEKENSTGKNKEAQFEARLMVLQSASVGLILIHSLKRLLMLEFLLCKLKSIPLSHE